VKLAPKRLLQGRPTFSTSIMVSVAVSKLGCTELFFLQPEVKVNGDYYHEVLLEEKLLPCIKEISGDNFIFQQDSTPAHRTRDTIALLRREMPEFISPNQRPPNSPDMNSVDYKIWAVMKQQVYEKRVSLNDIDELCQRLLSLWHSKCIGQNVIDEAIDQWRARLTACVTSKGRSF